MLNTDVAPLAAAAGIIGDNAIASYELLFNAVTDVNDNNVEGVICEIGVRMGYGIFTMMCAGGPLRHYIGIDPYGNILYADVLGINRYDYTNSMKRAFLKNIYIVCGDNDIEFTFFNLEDAEFFTRYADGIPLYYNDTKILETKYAVVHVDGPHTLEAVRITTEWFESRIPEGGYIIYDNIDHYNHSIVHDMLISYGFTTIAEINNKRAYKKVSRIAVVGL